MPERIKKPCAKIGCPNITTKQYCNEHMHLVKDALKAYDKQRGSAYKRGYTKEWSRQAKAFLALPNNQFCKLRLKGCTGLAECPDHIIPVTGPDDPRFYDKTNWQASCNHCNRLKGNRTIVGEG